MTARTAATIVVLAAIAATTITGLIVDSWWVPVVGIAVGVATLEVLRRVADKRDGG